jgi:hypothetical protein
MLTKVLAAALLVLPAAAAAPPPPPTGLRVTAITPTSVTLSWTASPGVTGYAVNYNAAFNDVYWSQPVGDVTTATITQSIRPTGQYRFAVAAQNADGQSGSSEWITLVTPAATTGDTTAPSTPGDLRITAVTPSGPALAWSPSFDDTGVTGYTVFFFDGWFTSTAVGTTTGTELTVPFMTSSFRRFYYVRARDAAGNLSIASELVESATTPTPTTPPPDSGCRFAYRTTSEWTGGFVAEVSITNTGTAAVDGWTLTFAAGGDQRVTTSWNAGFTQTGTDIVLTAERWNRTVAPGATVTAGLLGRWKTTNAPARSAALNGAACTVG